MIQCDIDNPRLLCGQCCGVHL